MKAIITKFHKSESGVAFLIAYILLSLFVFGMVYSIVSDIRDMTNPLYSLLSSNAGDLNDSDSLYGFDFLNFLISFSVVFFTFGLIWFAVSMSQKPEIPWQ